MTKNLQEVAGQDNQGQSLLKDRWLVLCVRHSGCTFCREELSLFHKYENSVHELGFKTAVVHMGSPESGLEMQVKYNLPHTMFISDPQKKYFELFQFLRGNVNQVLGPKNWLPAIRAGIFEGHGLGKLEGDAFQLGGSVIIDNGQYSVLHRSTYAGDIGDFSEMMSSLRKLSQDSTAT